MEEIMLEAQNRDNGQGKGPKSDLRRRSQVLGVVYSGGKPAVSISVSEQALVGACRKGANAIVRLKVGGDSETVVIKTIQYHPVSGRPIHADFQRISLTQKIEVQVPIHILGEADGVKNFGGLLQHELRAVRMRALPTKIPHSVDVDVTKLGLGDRIVVQDLSIPEGAELLDDPDHIVVHVSVVKVEAEAAAPAEAAAAEGAAQPELAAVKGKKDEEGRPIREAAPAAAAEAGKGPSKEPAAKKPAK
jgi:large subunit ribosomal protein L25